MAMVRFGLDVLTPCTLELGVLLSLRRSLMNAAGVLPGEQCRVLFEPPLSSDPTALRRFQKPAPPFVLRSVQSMVGSYQEGDRLQCEVLFLGAGIQSIGDFLVVLQNLGGVGLVAGGGCFEVAEIRCQGEDGRWRTFWEERHGTDNLVPDLIRLDLWLDRNWPAAKPLLLELVTPARLVADGRVLRRPRFDQLFRFMLRRVSSLLHAHCGIEPVMEPAALIQAAAAVEGKWLESCWTDWRELDGAGVVGSVGGVIGSLQLDGSALDDLLWVVLLATRFGIGKGSAYGAGSCLLRPVSA